MPAAYQNLIIEAGSNFSATITIDDVYQELYDLNGYTGASQMRKSYYSANSTADFLVTINPETGTVTLELDPPTTANIAPGRYVYDAILIDAAHNYTVRILEGTIDVSPRVTRI